jgi:hypothetical protein
VNNKIKTVQIADRHIFLPNEIFSDLSDERISNSIHRSFCYSYYYYISYLYRYSLYVKNTPMINQQDIKQKLGYNRNEKRIDYLIKQGGILDLLGYTLTTQDYPVSWSMDDMGFLQFKTIKELHEEHGVQVTLQTSDRNFKIKKPIKAFHRKSDSNFLDGIFYDVSNTHKVSYTIFELCMSNVLLGVYAFYIYGYIKMMNDLYGNEYQCPIRTLVSKLEISNGTLIKYFNQMEQCGLIEIEHQDFTGKGGQANTYKALLN